MKKTLLSVIVLLISTGFAFSAGVHEYPMVEGEQAVFQNTDEIDVEDVVPVQEPEPEQKPEPVLVQAETVEPEETTEETAVEPNDVADDPNAEVETIYGGTLNVGTQISEDELGVYMEFIPFWITPFGEEQKHEFIFALRTSAGDNLLSTTPEFSLALFNNLLFVGTSFPLGFDFSDEEDVEFVALQRAWVDIGYAWKFASIGTRAEYEVEYTNLPEQNVSVFGNAYWHFREKDHEYPYPWTITVGPNAEWVYSFNDEENFSRDKISLGARAEFKSMAQDGDEFPRAWSPMFAMTFLNRWEQQAWEMNSYEWVWDPALVFEVGLNPLPGIGFNFSAEVPIGDVTNDVYESKRFNMSLELSLGLY